MSKTPNYDNDFLIYNYKSFTIQCGRSGSGVGKKLKSGMNILDHISEILETIFCVKILKFCDQEIFFLPRVRNPRPKKNSDPGSGINIPDPNLNQCMNWQTTTLLNYT